MKIKSFFKDLLQTVNNSKRKEEAINKATPTLNGNDPISDCAKALHPGKIQLKVIGIRNSSVTSKTITFAPIDSHLPYFKAGQYMTLEFKVGNSLLTRTYSISSAPYQTRGDNPIVEITIKKKEGGITSTILFDEVKVGDVFVSEIGLGQFYYEPIRDSKNIMLLAGGGGITPFVSMLKEIDSGKMNANAVLLYGSTNEDDIIHKEELDSLNNEKIKVVHVISSPSDNYFGEVGFLNSELIKKYQKEDMTYFVCGPQKMYDYLKEELNKLSIKPRRIRYEGYGQPSDITSIDGYPSTCVGKTFNLKVLRGIKEDIIPANFNESLAVALERAGIKIHIGCRGGECGFCRIKVEKGDYFVSPYRDYRRKTDKEFSFVHSCSTYPLSDMTIRINID